MSQKLLSMTFAMLPALALTASAESLTMQSITPGTLIFPEVR